MGTDEGGSVDEAELLSRARAGDGAALEELYSAHIDGARRLASILAGVNAAEDLAADGFARVLNQIRAGRGPSSNFRAYLFTTIRNRYRDSLRTVHREEAVSDRPWVLDDAAPAADEQVEELDNGHAVAALTSLPEDWQRVLWHIEVEGRRVPEVADLLSTTPAAVSSLAYRAREGLKLAYLSQRLGPAPADRQCGWVQERLSPYVRGKLSPRATGKIDAHLPTCAACTQAMEDLDEVNRKLAGLVLPVVLVGGMGALDQAAGTAGSDAQRAPSRSPSVAAVSAVAGVLLVAAAVATIVWWPGGTGGTSNAPPPSSEGGPTVPLPSGSTRTEPADPTPSASPITGAVTQVPPTSTAPPTSPRPTSARPTTAPPPTSVVPEGPTGTRITGCGSYGSIAMPTTQGVSYALIRGDGRQGPWTVEAAPRSGYVIADGAQTRFGGNLGTYYPCPTIASAEKTQQPDNGWTISADVAASGAASYTMRVRFDFDVDVFVDRAAGVSGAGWACWADDGTTQIPLDGGAGEYWLQPDQQWVVCEFSYDGTDPPPVQLTLNEGADPPSGTATLRSEGVERDSSTF